MPLVCVGRAVGPFGVRGQLKFAYTTDHPEWLAARRQYLLTDPRSGESIEVAPTDVQVRPGDFLMRFSGYDAPEQVEQFKGWELGYSARRGELPRDAPDDVYLFELPGMQLRRPDGSLIGTVKSLVDSAAHTILELDLPGEPLVPFTREACPEVHMEEGWIVCTYPLL